MARNKDDTPKPSSVFFAWSSSTDEFRERTLLDINKLKAELQKMRRELNLPPSVARLIEAESELSVRGTSDNEIFHNSILCQVAMPRRRQAALRFERRNGNASLLLTAGRLWNGEEWVQQPLPYGPKARIVLIHFTDHAIRHKTPFVPLGRSTREFLTRVGFNDQGSDYRSLETQIKALVACRMQLGSSTRNGVANMPSIQPVRKFKTWIRSDQDPKAIWPETIELSQEYFQSSLASATPLDERAISYMMGNALALDIYTAFTHRLCRIRDPNGVLLAWDQVWKQFGQEYKRLTDFKKEFLRALKLTKAVYPDARVEVSDKGLKLMSSKPPIPRVMVSGF